MASIIWDDDNTNIKMSEYIWESELTSERGVGAATPGAVKAIIAKCNIIEGIEAKE